MGQPIEKNIESAHVSKSEFNWMAFLASSAYYAGKGKVGKGVVIALINFVPITMMITGIYCGKKANSELTQSSFNWGPAIAIGALQVVWACLVVSTLKGG